jgi:hypothetical protein
VGREKFEYLVKDDLDHQTAAGANGNFLAISEVCNPNLEAIATRARVVIDLECLVEGHVFDFNLIVYVEIVCHVGETYWNPGFGGLMSRISVNRAGGKRPGVPRPAGTSTRLGRIICAKISTSKSHALKPILKNPAL